MRFSFSLFFFLFPPLLFPLPTRPSSLFARLLLVVALRKIFQPPMFRELHVVVTSTCENSRSVSKRVFITRRTATGKIEDWWKRERLFKIQVVRRRGRQSCCDIIFRARSGSQQNKKSLLRKNILPGMCRQVTAREVGFGLRDVGRRWNEERH